MYPCSDLELWPMNVMILFWNDFMLIPIWYIFQTNILIISRDIKCSICQTNVLFSSFRLKKIWIWLNHHKGHCKRSEGQIWLLSFYLEAIFSKTVWFVLYLCRKRHKEGTNELSKDGFHLITLKVIFQGPKGPKRVKFGCCYFLPIFSKATW